MTHQSGITASQALIDSFLEAGQDGNNKRFIVATIDDTSIVESDSANKASDWHADLGLIEAKLPNARACYVLFKKDDGNWIFMAYVPDNCVVKDKMLYASTRATLKKQLGSMKFKEELFGTVAEDFSPTGYDEWKRMQEAEDPLTLREMNRKEEEELGDIYRGGASTYVHGVSFPVGAGVKEQLKGLTEGSVNYVSLTVDVKAEQINLVEAKTLGDIEDIKPLFPLDKPLFHFYRYQHAVRGQQYDEVIFIFSCPDGTGNTKPSPIKERMLFSSSKARATQLLEEQGLKVFKSFEYNEPNDINKAEIDENLHPAEVAAIKKFSKPKRAGSGKRRLIRDKR